MEGAPKTPRKEEFPRPTMALEDVKTPEDFLKAVDFNVINDIFDTLVHKSEVGGPVRNTGLLLAPERIEFVSLESAHGNTDTRDGLIALNWDGISEVNPSYKTLRILHTLMHEATHLRGAYSKHTDMQFDPEWKMVKTVRVGLREERLSTGDSSNGLQTEETGLSLNEAVTDDIAYEVLQEYLKRTGNAGLINDAQLRKKLFENRSYLFDRIALAVVVDALGRKFEVPRDEVWKGMVQAYMNGNADVKQLFSEIENEFEDDSNMKGLISFFSSSKEVLAGIDGLSARLIVDQVQSEEDQLKVLDRMIRGFDTEKYAAVLNLR